MFPKRVNRTTLGTKRENTRAYDIQAFYEKALDSFKLDSSGKQAKALCPFHDDRNPSLSINLETGVWHCFGCKEKGSIEKFYMKKYGVNYQTARNKFSEITGSKNQHTRERTIVETYDYIDEEGKVLFQTVRYEPKDFRQRRPDGKGGWIWNLDSVRLIPYNLPDLVDAKKKKIMRDGKILCVLHPKVYIVEGEKDADTLKELGFTATCNPMGAGKWKKEYNKYFKEIEVVIIPDNDDAGKNHAENIASNLKGIAKSVKIIELPNLPEKGDVSDWILAMKKVGKDAATIKKELLEIVLQTSQWVSEERKYLLTIADILRQDTEPTMWLVPDVLPAGSIVLLSAPPAHYKTWLALEIANCVSLEKDFLDRKVRNTIVYYIDRENPKAVLIQYLRKLGVPSGNDSLRIWPLWGEKEPPQFSDGTYLDLAKDKPLIIFDSLIRFYSKGIDENSSSDMSQIMGFLRQLTKEGATILVLHHAGKSEKSEYRGSSDILGGVDMAYTIKKDENSSSLHLNCIKSRFHKEDNIHINIISDETSMKFVSAPDPDEESIRAIREVISESKKSTVQYPKQKEIIELVRNANIDLGKQKILKLLGKGTGKYWDIIKGHSHNAIFYRPISVVQFSDRISNHKTEKLTNGLIQKPVKIFKPTKIPQIGLSGLSMKDSKKQARLCVVNSVVNKKCR
jgi:hypothetical protein